MKYRAFIYKKNIIWASHGIALEWHFIRATTTSQLTGSGLTVTDINMNFHSYLYFVFCSVLKLVILSDTLFNQNFNF